MSLWKWVLSAVCVLLVGALFQNCSPVKGSGGAALTNSENEAEGETQDSLAVEDVEVLPPPSAGASCDLADLKVQFPVEGRNGFLWNIRIFSDVDLNPDSSADYFGGTKTFEGAKEVRVHSPFITFNDSIIPVVSPAPGTVVAIQMGFPDEITTNAEECDATLSQFNYITIEHANGYRSRLSGLKQNSSIYSVGDVIPAGVKVGEIGASGCRYYPNVSWIITNCEAERIAIMPEAETLFEGQTPPDYAGPEDHVGHAMLYNFTDFPQGQTYPQFYSRVADVNQFPQGDNYGLSYLLFNVQAGTEKVCRVKDSSGAVVQTRNLTIPTEAFNHRLYSCTFGGGARSPGDHTFELLIDGQIVVSKPFTIVP